MGITNYLKRALAPVYKKVRYTSSRKVYKYAKYYNKLAIKSQTVFYESRDGQNMSDSPLAIFEYLLANDPDSQYYHIWSYVESAELSQMMAQYQSMPTVLFVKRNSSDYLRWLCQAEYVISNATLPFYFTRKPEQKYINTWHGTPLKKMGFDMDGRPDNAKNIVRNFLNATHLISPNQHTTKMYENSFRLKGLFQGEILEGGYPRIDQTFNVKYDDMCELLAQFSVQVDPKKKVIVYAPTWKGDNISQARDDIEQIHSEISFLESKHGTQYNFLVKVHPFIYQEAKKFQPISERLIPDVIDTNQLLGITDILVTDYSSIFFDFLVTDRPILFYCWDDDLYTSSRGKYFENSDLPGATSYTVFELDQAIADVELLHQAHRENYAHFKKQFVPFDDGATTARYVNQIFSQPSEQSVTVIKQELTKKSILFYPGGMRNNGITSSFLNLAANIDYVNYEVTCILDVPSTEEQLSNIARLPQEIKLLYRFAPPIYTLKESYQDLWCHTFSVKSYSQKIFPTSAYKKEMARLVGADTHFDAAIDFSGYSLFWGKLILAANASEKVCYMHSDMLADKERSVNGKQLHKINLNGLFSVYNKFDRLVSVSKLTMEVNARNLAAYASQSAFTYAQNTINIKKIIQTEPKEEPIIEEDQPSVEWFSHAASLKDEQTKTLNYWNVNPNISTSVPAVYSLDDDQPVIAIIASTMYSKLIYYKVKLNNMYLGWVPETSVILLTDLKVSEEEVDLTGRIHPKRESLIYSSPYKQSEMHVVSAATDYLPIYMTATKRVKTTQGNYLQLIIKKTEIGWLKEEDFVLSTLANTNRPLLKWLLPFLMRTTSILKNRQVVKDLPNRVRETIEVKHYGRVSGSNIRVWQTSAAKKVKQGTVVNPKDLVFILKEEKRQVGNYYQIETNQGKTGWLAQEQMVSLPKSAVEIFKTDYQQYMVVTQTDSVQLYAEAMLSTPLKISFADLWQVKETQTLTSGVTALRVSDKKNEVSGWLNQDEIAISKEHGVFNTFGQYMAFPKKEQVSFVTMGRLSPEKQQIKLIRAFKKYYEAHKNGVLYLIGSGELSPTLLSEITKLGLNERVHLVGQLADPFVFLARCTVFVLTSDYEGQPMVLLEAMTLGLPIISTDIPACRFVLEDGKYGLLTKTNDVDGIYEAMNQLTTTEMTFANFNFTAYNQEALADFYKIL